MVASRVMPALFTAISTVPKSSTAAASSVSTSSARVTSERTARATAEPFPGIAGFEVADHHAGAVPYEGFGDGVADALGAAGDHGDPVREK